MAYILGRRGFLGWLASGVGGLILPKAAQLITQPGEPESPLRLEGPPRILKMGFAFETPGDWENATVKAPKVLISRFERRKGIEKIHDFSALSTSHTTFSPMYGRDHLLTANPDQKISALIECDPTTHFWGYVYYVDDQGNFARQAWDSRQDTNLNLRSLQFLSGPSLNAAAEKVDWSLPDPWRELEEAEQGAS